MEDVLGGRTDSTQFQTFLDDWEAILARRVEEALAVLQTVEGLHGLVLAGSVGRGAPWPLSDIDLLPIYADDALDSAPAEIERRRLILLERWLTEGWWTGLDVGRLRFTRSEVERALQVDEAAILEVLGEDRWYFSLDKGFGGRAVLDPDGLATALATWFTSHRFTPAVVAFRLARARQELDLAVSRCEEAIQAGNPLTATMQLREAVKWAQTRHLEQWRHRDNSLGRIGTRFAILASAHDAAPIVETLNQLSDLGADSVWRRLDVAPDWVQERHDRSWRARRHVGGPISQLDDARDTIRVCALYGSRRLNEPPYPVWLAVPDEATLASRVARVRTSSSLV
jgi:predicted nucleotidyltransferase